jgi:hypothetical protein
MVIEISIALVARGMKTARSESFDQQGSSGPTQLAGVSLGRGQGHTIRSAERGGVAISMRRYLGWVYSYIER